MRVVYLFAPRAWLLGVIGLAWTGALVAAAPVATLPSEVRRVVFLGDSITYAGTYVGDIAAYFATRHPDQPLEFINLGLSSETVSGLSEEGHASGKFPRPDLHERLGRVLAQTRPQLVFACYGMNDGIYLPFDAARFEKFKSGIVRLHEAVTASGARIIHLTPPVYDDARGGHPPGYAAVLDRYAAWLLEQRSAAQWEVVDVHAPMQRFMDGQKVQVPGFFLAKDGVHPGSEGHWLMARAVLAYLGATDMAEMGTAAEMLADRPAGARIRTLVGQRLAVLRDAWLQATGHTRPGVKAGLPLAEAEAQAKAIGQELAGLR